METVKRCPKCGRALEVSHMVLGKLRTHPCACQCEISQFERDMEAAKRGRAQARLAPEMVKP